MASSGERTLPMAWTPCEIFSRTSEFSSGPHNAMNGFAAVSRTARPNPTMKFETAKAEYDDSTADGQKIRVPQA